MSVGFDLEEPPEAAVANLDLLLTEAALGTAHLFRPRGAAIRTAVKLALKPDRVAARSGELAAEFARIISGKSQVAPDRRDRRFAFDFWTNNPALLRIMQSYLAAGKSAEDILADAALSEDDEEIMKFLLLNITEVLAPTNNPITNPLAWYAAKESKGKSIVAGSKAFAKDMMHAPRLPEMVDTGAFEIGKNIAVTPGDVVFRSDMIELIQYRPQTAKVYRHPVLVVPPMINKFYAFDLAPGRSVAEYLLQQGVQTFVISWRNPTSEFRDWGFDAYGAAILQAMDVVESITGTKQTSVMGTCSGGIVTTMVMAYLAELGQLHRVASLILPVAVIDSQHGGLSTAGLNESTAKAAIAASAARGYLDGRQLAEVFAWLKPTDLIWSYWINNYLMGRRPPAFDILFWNADTTRMPAHLHRDFVMTALHNDLASPGQAHLMGVPLDTRKIDVEALIIGGESDHLCRWSATYSTTQMLGGRTQYVLVRNGHIGSIINPPDNPRATYRVNPENPVSPEEWYEGSTVEKGSWWPLAAKLIGRHGGGKKAAPASTGSAAFPSLGPAPGTYIFED
jgi:polyhydroxyalkanoate synthase